MKKCRRLLTATSTLALIWSDRDLGVNAQLTESDSFYLDKRQEKTVIAAQPDNEWSMDLMFSLRQLQKNNDPILFFELTVTRRANADGSFTQLPDGSILQTVIQLSKPDRPGVKSTADTLNYYASSIKVDYGKDQ